MKTFFFIIPTAYRTNAILRSDIFSSLKTKSKIVILSPFVDDEDFTKEFSGENVVHQALPALPASLVKTSRVREHALALDTAKHEHAKLVEMSTTANALIRSLPPKDRVMKFLRMLLRPFRSTLVNLFDYLEEYAISEPSFEGLLREHSPDGIVVGTLSHDAHDIAWLAVGRKHRVPVFVVDLPWNYFENRLYSVPRQAHIFVWNDLMKQELVDLKSINAELIHVEGCQRYDTYAKFSPSATREELFKSIGADPQKKLITYFVGTDNWHPHQLDVTKLLLEDIKAMRIPESMVLVRFGPTQRIPEAYISLQQEFPNLLLESADTLPNKDHVANLLNFADVNLSIFSSLALDAAVLNKPMIYTGLSGLDHAENDDAVIRLLFTFSFIRKALETGGVDVAYDKDTFRSIIGSYMNDPEQNAEKRVTLVNSYLPNFGTAGSHIADTIMQISSAPA